jgi:hypothetical protein
MSQKDQEYLLERAAQERAIASIAPNEIVREVHLRLAHEYEARANVSEVARRADNDVLGRISSRGQSS